MPGRIEATRPCCARRSARDPAGKAMHGGLNSTLQHMACAISQATSSALSAVRDAQRPRCTPAKPGSRRTTSDNAPTKDPTGKRDARWLTSAHGHPTLAASSPKHSQPGRPGYSPWGLNDGTLAQLPIRQPPPLADVVIRVLHQDSLRSFVLTHQIDPDIPVSPGPANENILGTVANYAGRHTRPANPYG